MNTETELKPCICGGLPVRYSNFVAHWFKCHDCNKSTHTYEHMESAIKAWNIRAQLEAPQVESEPVAYRSKFEEFQESSYMYTTDSPGRADMVIEPLFLKSQASVTVLPERVSEEEMRNQPDENIYCRNLGHNRALDAVAKLNATPIPIELLRRITKYITCNADYRDRVAARLELRELIK